MSDISTDFNDLSNEQQDFIVSWIKDNFKPIKTFNYRHSAYGLKQRFTSRNFYVSQEQFTTAMLKAGFKSVEIKNIQYFNISKHSPYFKIKH